MTPKFIIDPAPFHHQEIVSVIGEAIGAIPGCPPIGVLMRLPLLPAQRALPRDARHQFFFVIGTHARDAADNNPPDIDINLEMTPLSEISGVPVLAITQFIGYGLRKTLADLAAHPDAAFNEQALRP